MGKVFIFTIFCLGLTLVLSAMVIWDSYDEAEQALYESEFLDLKTAETRENAGTGGAAAVDPDSEPASQFDYADLTPGLQQFLREGKPNAEITVDRIR